MDEEDKIDEDINKEVQKYIDILNKYNHPYALVIFGKIALAILLSIAEKAHKIGEIEKSTTLFIDSYIEGIKKIMEGKE